MKSRSDIENELRTISQAVADIPFHNPYQLPANYFETLPEVVLANVIAGVSDKSAVLDISGRKLPYQLPAGYFDGLSSEILSKIKEGESQSVQEELKTISPVIAQLSRNNVYEVPGGYFDELSETIVSKTNQSGAKVIALSWNRYFVRYAAAIVIVLGLSFGFYLVNSNKQKAGSVVSMGLKIKSEQQFQEKLAQLDADELISYLQRTGSPDEVRDITALVETKDMPEETDYLDENFLDSYLQELENNTSTLN